METIVLYFIGTHYKSGSPVFNVRGNVYQPRGLGSAIEVRAVDVKDLVVKAIAYGEGGRAYQGFTRDPNLAAAVKQSRKPIAVDATLAEQAQAAVSVGDKRDFLQSLVSGGGVTQEDLLAFLEENAPKLPEKKDEEPKSESKTSSAKKTSTKKEEASEDTKEE